MTNKTFQLQLGDAEIKVEVGALAGQASGSCLLQMGETSLLATSQLGQDRPEMGFFPLTCEFEERHYAAGKILGSRFVRREGRPSIEATLSARMIDRTIRPLFPDGLTSEIQVIATCLSWDAKNDPDVLGILGASLSLGLSEIPWQGPLGAVRVAKLGEQIVLNPTYEQREQCQVDLVLSGQEQQGREGPGKQGEILINMLDGRGEEVSEEALEEIFDFALPHIKTLLDFQKEIIKQFGKKKIEPVVVGMEKKFENDVKKLIKSKLEKALYQSDKKAHKQAMFDLAEEIKAMAAAQYGQEHIGDGLGILDKEVEAMLKENILNKEKRPDGRKIDQVRDLSVKVGLLPRTHGSGLFQRGETTVLSILTLGAPGDQLMQETMEFSGKKRFMLHYNFPPYSVGEVKRLVGPGRREIGHGMLAEKALQPLLPNFDDFPYTIRAVSEVVSSNGSSSMASVSAACLALMDAGVPILRPAAGIAIGLIRGKDKTFKLLTDIQGPEDHYGDMDFKAGGTKTGVTVLQMDVKGQGITKDIFQQALRCAKKARLEILKEQDKILAKPRPELSPYAPKIQILQINPEKIGMVIGSGGKTINQIIDECQVEIDIEEDGRVFVSSEQEGDINKAVDWIKGLTKEVKVGEVVEGIVKNITDFGAFVEVAPGQDGLVHISQFVPERINKVEDVVKRGDKIPVKVIGIDETGKISLSAKAAGFKPSRSPRRA